MYVWWYEGPLAWAASALNYDHWGATVVQPLMHPNMAELALFYVCIFYYLESMDHLSHTQVIDLSLSARLQVNWSCLYLRTSTSYAASYVVFGAHFQKERTQGKCSILGISSFKKGWNSGKNSCCVCMWVRAFQELSTEFMEITHVYNFWLKANVCYYECLYKDNLYKLCMHAGFCMSVSEKHLCCIFMW